MNETVLEVLIARLRADFWKENVIPKDDCSKYLTAYQHVVNYLLGMFATYEIIAETESAFKRFTQLVRKNSLQKAEKLVAKILLSKNVYEE